MVCAIVCAASRQQRGVAMIEHGDLAWMRHLAPVERAELEAQVRALWTAGNDAAATDLLEAREAALVLPAPVRIPDRPTAG